MQLHTIKRNSSHKKAKYIGRGGKRGKTSGKGHKGQSARAGRKMRPEWRDLIKKLPKRRGYGKNRFVPLVIKPEVVNLSAIEDTFMSGDIVTPTTLVAKKLIKPKQAVKILGSGSLTKKLAVSGCTLSATARKAILAAGGSVR
ncbi:MAG: 50S ribosomal protein L15 [Candidatus Vogelbacteria bacterium]|nr:50S ribosomal protein L15 [Candidatus Vogelbacteria bacterium]